MLPPKLRLYCNDLQSVKLHLGIETVISSVFHDMSVEINLPCEFFSTEVATKEFSGMPCNVFSCSTFPSEPFTTLVTFEQFLVTMSLHILFTTAF